MDVKEDGAIMSATQRLEGSPETIVALVPPAHPGGGTLRSYSRWMQKNGSAQAPNRFILLEFRDAAHQANRRLTRSASSHTAFRFAAHASGSPGAFSASCEESRMAVTSERNSLRNVHSADSAAALRS